jgi:hypothetical protein
MNRFIITIASSLLLCSCGAADQYQFSAYQNSTVSIRETKLKALKELSDAQQAIAKATAEVSTKDPNAAAFTALALSVGNRQMADAVSKIMDEKIPEAPTPSALVLSRDAMKYIGMPGIGYMAFKTMVDSKE